MSEPAPAPHHDEHAHEATPRLPEHLLRKLETIPVMTPELWESFAIDDITDEEAEAFLRAVGR